MAEHSVLRIAVIAVTLLVMVVMFVINAGASGNIFPGLFINSDMEAQSEKYYNEITPAGWTFSIWGAIYLWQVLFIGYGLSTICRPNPSGGYLYCSSPVLMPIWMYVIYIINNILNITWLIVFDREYMPAALAVLALICATLYVALVLSIKAVQDNMAAVQKLGMMKEVWLIRFLVQNAFAFYATWCTIATLLNFTIVMSYSVGLDQSLASTISLGILCGEITLWLILDFFVLHKYTNYLFSPYIVLPIALGGSIAKNFNAWHHNTIITVALLGVALAALIIKFILLFVRHCRNQKMVAIDSTLEKEPIPA